jgi:hypothetical protein
MERKAKISDIIVNMTGNIALFAKVRSPMFACVSIISKNEDMIVAFDDFIAKPINRAIKLIVTITTDFKISCT